MDDFFSDAWSTVRTEGGAFIQDYLRNLRIQNTQAPQPVQVPPQTAAQTVYAQVQSNATPLILGAAAIAVFLILKKGKK